MALGMASSYLPLWQWQVLGYLSSGHSGSVWLGQVFGGLLLWAAPHVWSGWVLGCVSYDLPLEGIYIMSIHKNVGSDPLMYTYIQRRRCLPWQADTLHWEVPLLVPTILFQDPVLARVDDVTSCLAWG